MSIGKDKYKLWEQYLIDLNNLEPSKPKPFKSNFTSKLDVYCMYAVGLSLGIITLYVAIEQIIRQIGVYLR